MKNKKERLNDWAGGVKLCTLLLLAFSTPVNAETFPDPLPAEPVLISESLDTPYPASYAVVCQIVHLVLLTHTQVASKA